MYGIQIPNDAGLDITERNVVEPTGIVQVYKDYWWWCVGGDPKRAIFFRATRRHPGFAQCNLNQEIVEAIGARMGYDKVAEMVKIPLAFVPWETS